nr:unnamed protein product [Digitaria exilis]
MRRTRLPSSASSASFLATTSRSSPARRLNALPSSPRTTSRTARATSSARNSPNLSCGTRTAAPSSAASGSATIGTPAASDSITELHPQCVTNAPHDPCPSTRRCGAHPSTTNPRAPAANPRGSARAGAAPPRCSSSSSPAFFGNRTTHTNRSPLSSRPRAICSI